MQTKYVQQLISNLSSSVRNFFSAWCVLFTDGCTGMDKHLTIFPQSWSLTFPIVPFTSSSCLFSPPPLTQLNTRDTWCVKEGRWPCAASPPGCWTSMQLFMGEVWARLTPAPHTWQDHPYLVSQQRSCEKYLQSNSRENILFRKITLAKKWPPTWIVQDLILSVIWIHGCQY